MGTIFQGVVLMKKRSISRAFFISSLSLVMAVIMIACGDSSEIPLPGDSEQDSSFDSDRSINFATAVNTTLKTYPANPSDSSDATFTFKCNKRKCAYKCQLDAGIWGPCTSPKTYFALTDGSHNFKVKAKDKATGKWDKSPASWTWSVSTGGAGTADLKQISSGENHACGVANDGSLWCWGKNLYGQLGDNSNVDKDVATQENSHSLNWKQVSAGGDHTCGVKISGQLFCWGNGSYGQLGNAAGTFIQMTPVRENSQATNWKQVSGGYDHTCAVKTNGTLYCWGYNLDGELGDSTLANKNTPTQAGTDTNWSQVAASYYHTCAVKTNGTLYCWGSNSKGVLGLGSSANSWYSSPQQVGSDTNWKQVGGGPRAELHTCAVKTTGELYCWGSDDYGQMGLGTNPNFYLAPTKVGSDLDWNEVADGYGFTCATKTDNTLYCWGYNFYGQVGDASLTNRRTPVQVGSDNTWSNISAGYMNTCGAKSGNTGHCWGYNQYGQLGNGTTGFKMIPNQVGSDTNWTQVLTGDMHTCSVKSDNTLFCFGYNVSGSLGDGTTIKKQVPVQIGGADWSRVEGGNNYAVGAHTCGIKTDKSLFCWGYNMYGQIGDGTTGTRLSPTLIGSDTTWTQLSVGDKYSLARKTDNSLWFWGYNYYGQLGDGTTANKKSPTAAGGGAAEWAQVAADYGHICGVKTSGTLFCWGWNIYGQLGDGTTGNRKAPVQESSSATTWSQSAGTLGVGYWHSCAIKTNDTLFCWGSNGNYQLGIGTYDQKKTSPFQVGTDTDWSKLGVGAYHTCAIKTNGALFCWGQNGDGRCGDGTTNSPMSPAREATSATDWANVSPGLYFTCANKTTGALFCWGDNQAGELGDGQAWSDNPILVTP